MKINGITLKNIGQHAELQLDLKRVTRITGPNARGKSFIKDAVEYAFTGTARGLRHKKDRGMLKRDGAKTGRVSLDIEHNGNSHLIERSTSGKCTWTDDMIRDGAGDPRLARLLADSLRVVDLSAEERQKVFTAYASKGEVDLAKYIGERLHGKLNEFRVLGLESMGLVSAAGNDIDAAIKDAVLHRREFKAAAKALENVEPPAIPTVRNATGTEIGAGKAPKDKIEAGIKALETKRDGLVGEIGGATLASPAQVDAEIAECQEVVKLGGKAEERLPDIQKAQKSLVEKLKRRNTKTKELETKRADFAGQISVIERALKAFAETEPDTEKAYCVATNAVHCPLGAKGQADAVEGLRLESDDLRSQQATVDLEIEKIAKEIADLNKELDEVDGKAIEAGQEVGRVQPALNRIKELEKTKAGFAKVDANRKEIDALDERLTKGRALLQTINDYQSALRQHHSDRKAHEEYLKAADLWDDLEKLLSGDGRAYMAETAKGAVMPQSLMKAWGINVEIDSEGDVYYTDERNQRPRRPVQMCSNSEQLRAGIALTACLSVNSGKKWFIVDEAEILDETAMDALLQWATGQQALDTLLIIGTTGEDTPEDRPDGMAFYRL